MSDNRTIASPGLHHVTAIAGPAPRNHAFYVRTLGLRLVKKTVNFDDPETYHLYYADQSGTPGSVITFFPWRDAGPGQIGAGETSETAFAVAPDALAGHVARLIANNVATHRAPDRFGATVVTFRDIDGMSLALVGDSAIRSEASLAGFHSVTLNVHDLDRTAEVFRHVLGWDESGREGMGDTLRVRFSAPPSSQAILGQHVDLLAHPQERGKLGAGSVHHIAFRARSDADQAEMGARVAALGLPVTPQKDRNYFRSIYFREPGGVLFEIATDAPGFGVDESLETLGTALKLPPQHEHLRAKLGAVLEPL